MLSLRNPILLVPGAAVALLLAACSTSPSPTASPTSGTASPTTSSASPTSPSPSTTSPSPSPSTTSPTPSPSVTTTPGVTSVTVRLTGQALCVGGLLGAHNTTTKPLWEKGVRIPASGVVTFAVPTAYTRHLAFDVNCARWPNIDAVPIIGLQLRGVDVGASAPTAPNGKPVPRSGSYCWAGTTGSSTTITVTGWIDLGDGSPLSGTIDLWADPALPTVVSQNTGQHWMPLPLAHQDEPYC